MPHPIFISLTKQDTPIAEALRGAQQLAPRDIFVLRRLGKALLDAGERVDAKVVIDRILPRRMREHNVWTRATTANAAFFLGDDAQATEALRHIVALRADAGSLASIEKGLQHIAARVDGGSERVVPLLEILREAAPT